MDTELTENAMNISRILALNIPDIHPAYRGVREKTWQNPELLLLLRYL